MNRVETELFSDIELVQKHQFSFLARVVVKSLVPGKIRQFHMEYISQYRNNL